MGTESVDMAGVVDTVDYGVLVEQVRGFCDGSVWWIGALSEISALIMESLPDLNWVGFYLRGGWVAPGFSPDCLMLGPFQGRVACTSIAWGRGVCGTAAARDETVVVDDVHTFAGHIACDSASRSECVVPLHDSDGRVVGVLDIDSPVLARFSGADVRGLEALASVLDELRFLE